MHGLSNLRAQQTSWTPTSSEFLINRCDWSWSGQVEFKMPGSTPPRKWRSAAGAAADAGVEEAWLVAEAPAKAKAKWRVTVSFGRRGHFNSFVLLLLVLFVVLAVPITTRNDDGNGSHEQREAATATVPPLADAGDDGEQGDDLVVGECDMSSGRWVYDDAAYPLYKESACEFMSDQSACGKFGRTDLKYQQWRWQPHGCDLPRFDAVKLLRRLRNKRLAFVGDSLNRNQWISMVCLIDTATPTLHKSMAGGNTSLVTFKIHEYNASVDFYWSPLLVESNSDDPVHHRVDDRVVRAGSIARHARRWADADVLVFNSYLWWRRPTMKILRWGSFQAAARAEGAHRAAYEVTGSLRAFEMALRTWSEWLELHVDRARAKLFFTSTSPTHLHSDEWDHRKDAHPSVHRRQWTPLTEAEMEARARDPSSGADCVHWCLPGVPDVWNQMLYAHIMSSS
ncbi:unnamed protein product [Urochloa decumbens]|uniref:Trichome birefringence-like N-terminal domain-containing protein n=1 Tax=Urochloa decumbens TaxID=240449 RepID=A0ABC8XM02_9POAL